MPHGVENSPEALIPLQLKGLLLDYKAGRVSSHGLMDGALALLRAPARRHLLTGFSAFVPKADKAWFARCIRHVPAIAKTSAKPV